MRHQDNIMVDEGHSSASFHKDDDSKRPSFAEDDGTELQFEEVFNGSNGSLDSGSHGSTEDKLIRQFNASVGSKALERSVASFYLEMCDGDLHAAVTFYKEQNNTGARKELSAKPYPTPRPAVASVIRQGSSHHHQPKRISSFDTAQQRYRTAIDQSPRRIKSFDTTEAARVTSPSVYRSDHSRYPQKSRSSPQPTHHHNSNNNGNAQFSHRRATQCVQANSTSYNHRPPKPVVAPRNSSGGAQFSHRRATQCVVQLPNRRDTPWGRSKSEHHHQDAGLPHSTHMIKSSSAHSGSNSSSSNSPRRRHHQRRSLSPKRNVGTTSVSARGVSRSISPMRNSDSQVYQMNKGMDFTEAASVTGSRPPLPPPSSREEQLQQRSYLQHQQEQQRSRSWEPPTARAAHSNPAA